MKKATVIILIAITAIISLFGLTGCAEEEKPLRLHIRANSNTDADQTVKLTVRDAVVDYLTPILKEAKNVDEAKKAVKRNEKNIVKICDDTLKREGFFYGAELRIAEEYFPTRSYGDLTLEGGVYEAVIIELGSGEGNNWWCVAYPPLCFGGEEAEYRSLIKDFINSRR